MESYEDYSEMDREVVFLRLNIIKGESIGVITYILDKENKLLVLETTNLYSTISDINNKIIVKKLLMVSNSIAKK